MNLPLVGMPLKRMGGGKKAVSSDLNNEDKIAEAIFDWWVSCKSYKEWYFDKYIQQKLNFEDNKD